jgi:hypothetical protein
MNRSPDQEMPMTESKPTKAEQAAADEKAAQEQADREQAEQAIRAEQAETAAAEKRAQIAAELEAALADETGAQPIDPAADKTDLEAYQDQRRDENRAAEARDGAVIDQSLASVGEPAFVVKPVAESAPEGVDTDRAANVSVLEGELAPAPATMAEQKAPRLKGQGYAQGYVGVLPTDADGNREDLTLAAVIARQPADDRATEGEGA